MFKPLYGTPLNLDHPLSNGLVAAYLFNEGTGKFAWDATGNGNDGTCTGMADPGTGTSGWSQGPHGWTLAFDHVNDWVDTTAFSRGDVGLTVSAWVNLGANDAANGNWIASQRNAAALDQWDCLVLPTSKKFAIQIWDTAGNISTATAANLFPVGSWVHVVGTTVGAAGASINVYQNGVLVGTGNMGANPARAVSFLTRVGHRSWQAGGVGQWNGKISSVLLFNRTLSTDEIAYLYAFPYCMFEEESYPAWMIPPSSASFMRERLFLNNCSRFMNP